MCEPVIAACALFDISLCNTVHGACLAHRHAHLPANLIATVLLLQGLKNAVPKSILALMNVEGMTRENVASHLQASAASAAPQS